MDKRFWGVLAAVIIILGGIFFATRSHSNTSTTANVGKPTNHIEGQGQDHITLIEYGDYECPYCGEYFPIVKQVAQIYSNQIYFQFRNLPLTEIHPNAFAGARAAEAASLMGKFWQMHDLLYENQSQWVSSSNPETYFVQYAKKLGLNTATFQKDYNSATVNNFINADVAAFQKTGAQEATPTFFLDGKQINPAINLASFESIINAEIKKKGFTPPAAATVSSTPTTVPTSPTTNKSVQPTTTK